MHLHAPTRTITGARGTTRLSRAEWAITSAVERASAEVARHALFEAWPWVAEVAP